MLLIIGGVVLYSIAGGAVVALGRASAESRDPWVRDEAPFSVFAATVG